MKVYICKNERINSREFAKMCLRDYTGETQTDFTFVESEFGKPLIDGVHDLHFSLSHSSFDGRAILICAVARFNIGADCQIINIKDTARCRKIAERFYSPHENLFLNRLPESDYTDNFFKIWTKKEAYIKYTGKGLAEGLSTFSVLSLDSVRFKRIAPELSGAYIYLCCSKADSLDGLEVRQVCSDTF